MKSLLSSRRIAIPFFLVIAVILVACERQLDQNGGDNSTPAAPVLTQPVLPTTDPSLFPTTDPALLATVDPALIATPDPSLQATPIPGTSVEVTPANQGQTTHVVVPGDTLFSIALQYGTTVEELAAANNIATTDVLNAGQTLIIPAAGAVAQPTAVGVQPTTTAGEQVHIVAPGENLFRIGLQYGFTVAELAAYNNIYNPDYIYVGQTILIPPGGSQ